MFHPRLGGGCPCSEQETYIRSRSLCFTSSLANILTRPAIGAPIADCMVQRLQGNQIWLACPLGLSRFLERPSPPIPKNVLPAASNLGSRFDPCLHPSDRRCSTA